MTTTKPELPLLSRRIRRWQEAAKLTNERAADYLGIPLRTYTNIRYGEHVPRGTGFSLLSRLLDHEEKRLKLPTLE